MKAIRMHAYGNPEVLQLDEVMKPEPGPKDLLVRVEAAAVNPVDWKIRMGTQKAINWISLPWILGLDFSGVVEKVGAKVEDFQVGDEVYGSPSHNRPGCYAQYLAVKASEVALKPKNLSFVEAASVPLVGLTAWQCLKKGRLGEGQKVFVQAGAGGVGTMAIQMAKHLGATVTTTCSPPKADFVKELGADEVINYREVNFEEVLEDQDMVLDCLGFDEMYRALEVIKKGGRLVSITSELPKFNRKYGPYLGIGAIGMKLAWLKLYAFVKHGVHFHFVTRWPNQEQLREITTLLEAEKINPVIDRTYSLDKAAEAHAYSQTGKARGKIVLEVSH